MTHERHTMTNALEKLLGFLRELDARRVHYRLSRPRDEAVMVEVFVPGQRWEVEFFADAHVEIEVFRSIGGVREESALEELWPLTV